MDCHVTGPRMSRAIEVMTNVLLHVPPVHHSKVGFESVHESTLGLSYILNLASLAGDAVDQVTCDINSRLVCPASASTFQFPRGVQDRTISAISGFAGID